MTEDELVEAMAEAAWNLHAHVPFASSFRGHPENKKFYLDNMRAALAIALPYRHEGMRINAEIAKEFRRLNLKIAGLEQDLGAMRGMAPLVPMTIEEISKVYPPQAEQACLTPTP